MAAHEQVRTASAIGESGALTGRHGFDLAIFVFSEKVAATRTRTILRHFCLEGGQV